MLHGIELAKPEEWWILADDLIGSPTARFVRVEGAPCSVGLDEVETFVCRYREEYGVVCGMTGAMIGWPWTQQSLAVDDARKMVARLGRQYWTDRLIQWLETHPLSPRYRYTGGG